MIRTRTVSMVLLREMIRARKRMHGSYDTEALFSKYGVSQAALLDDSKRIPVDLFYAGSKESSDATNDPILGLNMTLDILDQRDIKEFHIDWQRELVYGARFVSGALELSGRYMGLIRQDFDLEMVFGPVESRIIWHQFKDSHEYYHHVDGVMLLAFHIAKSLGGEGYTRLHLRHSCPEGYRQDYEDAFGIPIFFEQEENCFYLNNAWWSSERDCAESVSLKALLEGEVELAGTTQEYSLPEQIVFALRKTLYTGQVSIHRVADTMGVNVRTLQRRLKESGVLYKDLVEEARKQLAVNCLLSPSRTFSMEEIALFSGYNDVRDFFRAFKRWMGVGPGEYRRENLPKVFPALSERPKRSSEIN